MSERWRPGDIVTLRYTGHSDGAVIGKPGWLQGWPYVVAEDRDDLLALWMPVGTRMTLLSMADRTIPHRELIHGNHPRDAFRRGEVLRLMLPGKPYSIWLHWTPDAERTFLGWYVNLEAPFVRTPIGVDTTDNSLDLVVMPDFSWHWKDEEHTQRWIDLGVYTREETDSFYEHGREVIADVDARRFPFDGSYLDWRPDPAWTTPTLVEGWDRVPDYDLPRSTGRRLTGVDHPQ
jgi:hypothetical protein